MGRLVNRMKYAVFDDKGFPKGFYSKDIHGNNIPKEAIQITDEQWQEFISNQGRRKWDFETNSVVEYNPEDELTLEDWKERKRKEIAQARYEAETGGLTLPNGYVVKTDRESQSLLMAAALNAKEDPNYILNWKCANGWIQVDAETILKVAQAVREHVEMCFDKERLLHEQIDKCETIEEVKAIEW